MTEKPEDPEIGYRLDALAGVVRSELTAAGLPVTPDDHPLGTAGATVQVDRPDLHGVLVHWHAHPILMDAGQAAWADDPFGEGEEYEAFGRQTKGIGHAMQEAMREILTVAGLEVVDTNNDYAPDELLVTRRVTPSAWRARHDATFTRRHEGMLAAWNERHREEYDRNRGDQD
ncbi:hypothetical protein [Amycolatopsis minnesotensis]|uniref:Uncharacterized protein n=1 Tax=Amycolatopsis minnesotensis TaxID=337894 RepID=A0ABP5CS87_9PSEU